MAKISRKKFVFDFCFLQMCLCLIILTFSIIIIIIIIIIITVDNVECLNLNFLVGEVGRRAVGREGYKKALGIFTLDLTSRSGFATE